MAQALYRKWRPQTFDDVIGQEHVVQTLRNAIASGRVAHAYLFSGPRGTGKTTMARLLAKAVNCLNDDLAQRPDDTCSICMAIDEGRMLDLIELDAASNRGIDEVRDLRDKINFSPGEGRYKVYIIDEVHMMTEAAFNALLKTLEEPPPHAIFILATTDPQKVPITIVSRCQPFSFRLFTLDEIVARLQEMVDAENVQADAAALALIARQATGSMRDAISLLDQMMSNAAPITLEMAQSVLGAGALEHVMALADAWVAGDSASGLNIINEAIDQGADARQFARQIVDYLRGLMLIKLGDATRVNVSDEQRVVMAAQAARIDVERLLRATRQFNQAALELRTGWQPQLPLELAFVESLNRAVEVAPRSAPVAPDPAPAPTPKPARTEAKRKPKENKTSEVATATVHVDQLRQHWTSILAEVKTRSVPTWGLMNSCELIGVEGDQVVLKWPSRTLCEKFEKGKDVVEQIISQALGHKLRTRCDVDDDPIVREARRLGGQMIN